MSPSPRSPSRRWCPRPTFDVDVALGSLPPATISRDFRRRPRRDRQEAAGHQDHGLERPWSRHGLVLASGPMSALTQLWAQITTPLGGLLVALSAFAAFYLVSLWNAVTKAKPRDTALELGTGFVTNFFDTLGHRVVCADDGDLQVLQDRSGSADSRHAECRTHRADDRAGVHLHRDDRRRSADLDLHDHCGGRWRLARRGHCRQVAQTLRPDRHGLGVDRRGGHLRVAQSRRERLPVRRRGDTRDRRCGSRHARSAGHEAGDWAGRQLRAGRLDDARHRAVRPVHDSGRAARHERESRVPDHDELLRVPDAGEHREVRRNRTRIRFVPRWHSPSPACRPC